jgi:hypothetical protein
MKALFITFLLFSNGWLYGQTNVLQRQKDQELARAKLSDIGWLGGYWKGEAFGGIIEELWAPPTGTSMMGTFKLREGEATNFYEMMTISEEKGSLVFRLKHFDPTLKGWEEKDESITAWLVKKEKNKLFFEGFTFEKKSDDEIIIYVAMENEDGIEEMSFQYKRAAF